MSQVGWLQVQEMPMKTAESEGHLTLAASGPQGGNRRYLYISRQTARTLIIQLGRELASDAKRRMDSEAARALLAAVNDARDETDSALIHIER